MKFTKETEKYNERRYGKPWIAKVDFKTNPKGDFTFGDWIGQGGDEGVLILENVSTGDTIATGQKDYRKPRNSRAEYAIIQEDGTLKYVSKAEAFKHAIKS